MNITGVTYAYFHYCLKRMWLFYNQINMEHNSDIVSDGKINHDTTKDRRSSKFKELSLGCIKIYFYDDVNNIIYETKRNFKHHSIDEYQLKYYLYIFWINGNKSTTGILEYPKNKKKYEIKLTEKDILNIDKDLINIKNILTSQCPNIDINKKCKNCSYLEFCES